MSVVIDSSVALAWIYSEETTEPVRLVLEMVMQNGAWVPFLWRLEVANVLEVGIRRKRHRAVFRDSSLADLALLPINTDTETEHHAWGTILHLAERHSLALYDAAYLELALRRRLPLATLDIELRKAAQKEKVALFGR